MSLRKDEIGNSLRATRLFVWANERWVPWRESQRDNSWHEFEEACGERDPEVVARLLMVQQALNRVAEASRSMVQAEKVKRCGGA